MSKLTDPIKRFISDPLRLHRYDDKDVSDVESKTRITAWVNSGYKTRAEISGHIYWWMFGEDLNLRVMPYTRGATSTSLCPKDDALEKLIFSGLGSHRGYSSSLHESIENFVRDVTQIIYSYGDAYYEIEYPQVESKSSSFKLQLIYTPSMKKIFGQYFQIITPAAAKYAKIKIGVTKIPKERILYITSPSELGGHHGLKKIMRGLISNGDTPTPKFSTEALISGNDIGFNIEEYDLNRFIYRAKLTKKFGWSQRRDADSPILEYYWLTRVLRQARAIIVIREHILAQLNDALSRKILDGGQKIYIKGPYTLKDVEEAETSLKAGNVNVNEIVKKFV